MKLSVVDIIDPQSNKFAVGVEAKVTDDANLYDSPVLKQYTNFASSHVVYWYLLQV